MSAENIFSHIDGVYQIDGGFLSLALGWYPQLCLSRSGLAVIKSNKKKDLG